MQKRGIAQNVIGFLMVGFIALAIAVVGISAVKSVKDKVCKTELSEFEIYFKGIQQSLRIGTVEKKTMAPPCGAEMIYFFDGKTPPQKELFEEFPLIQDSLRSKTQKNVFLIKDSEVLHSFTGSTFEIAHPYVSCLIPSSNKLDFRIEGKGNRVALTPSCGQKLCIYPEKFDREKLRAIFRESIRSGCPGCILSEERIEEELEMADLFYENVDVYRSVEYCDGLTKIHLIFRPKEGVSVSDFRFFDILPKNCIETLDSVLLRKTEPSNGVSFVDPDPLLMWGFSTLDSETEVSYDLDITLTDECASAIEGGAIARSVEIKGETLTSPRQDSAGGQQSLNERLPSTPTTSSPNQKEDTQTKTAEPSQDTGANPKTQEPTPENTNQIAPSSPSPSPSSFEIITSPVTEGVVDEQYSYRAQVSDLSKRVEYSLSSKPEGMSINKNSGKIYWVPKNEGPQFIEILARSEGRQASQQFTIQVKKNSATSKCQSNWERQCFGGDAYYFDSCGKQETLADDCFFSCKKGKCCGPFGLFCS